MVSPDTTAEPEAPMDVDPFSGATWCIDPPSRGSTPVAEWAVCRQISEVRTVCVRSASTDLCGGCRVTGIPTATQPAGDRPWSFYILLVTFMGISPGGARESSPWREPWEQTRTARSPGGAKEPFHGDSPIAGHERPAHAPTGLARLWAGPTGLTPWAIF